jgi:hypothetical protein
MKKSGQVRVKTENGHRDKRRQAKHLRVHLRDYRSSLNNHFSAATLRSSDSPYTYTLPPRMISCVIFSMSGGGPLRNRLGIDVWARKKRIRISQVNSLQRLRGCFLCTLPVGVFSATMFQSRPIIREIKSKSNAMEGVISG